MLILEIPGEVHVWRFSLDVDQDTLTRLDETLRSDERARASRYRTETLQGRFVAGRGLLREILAGYLDRDPSDLAFSYGPNGKPSLEPSTGLEFNLSHSGGVALLALTKGVPIGVDVEEIDPRRDVQGILGRFFAEGEQAEFLTLPDDESQKVLTFYRGWARKEAFLKAVGTGLTTSLDSFEVSLAAEAPSVVRVGDDPGEASRWSLRDLDAGPRFAAAVVVNGPILEVSSRDWRPGLRSR